MSSIVYLRNSKSNTIYAYLNESIWDPEKKKNVYKRKCIGHLDPSTGEIVPNRLSKARDNPVVRSTYLCKVLDKISEECHLTEALKLSFPDDWKKIASIAYYLLSTDEELSFYKQWSTEHKTPYNQVMNTNAMNELLSTINSNGISLFFTLWKLRLQPEETYSSSIDIMDSGSDLSSLSREINKDISDFNTNLRMTIFYSTRNNLPISYILTNPSTGREIGDYDVSPASFSRLSSFIDESSLDSVDPSLIPYADSNVTARAHPDNEFVSDIVSKSEPSMTNPANYRTILGTPMFIETYMQHINGRRYYVHIFFDPNQAVSDLSSFISIINICKYELEMDRPVEAHQDLYDTYLIVEEDEFGRKQVELNSEAIMHHNKHLGYNVLVSNFTRNPNNAITPFLQKKAVSVMFESIRNEYDNTALNLFTETNYLNRIFIQFVSLILRIQALNIMNAKKLNRTMSFKEMIRELSNIKTVKMPDAKRPLTTFMNDTQVHILDVFGVSFDDE